MSDGSLPLILGTASPRRRELLARAGIPFSLKAADVQEVNGIPGEAPEASCIHNARLKVDAIARETLEPALILTADTIVVVDEQVLGKPTTPADALQMLQRLSGRSHQVLTALVALRTSDLAQLELVVRTHVRFHAHPSSLLEAYIQTGEPFDKAGGYGIQGIGAMLVASIDGSYTNVVGLPLVETLDVIRQLGGPRPFAVTPVV